MAAHSVESISTEEELKAAVDGHSLLLVDFMASWCVLQGNRAPEYCSVV